MNKKKQSKILTIKKRNAKMKWKYFLKMKGV